MVLFVNAPNASLSVCVSLSIISLLDFDDYIGLLSHKSSTKTCFIGCKRRKLMKLSVGNASSLVSNKIGFSGCVVFQCLSSFTNQCPSPAYCFEYFYLHEMSSKLVLFGSTTECEKGTEHNAMRARHSGGSVRDSSNVGLFVLQGFCCCCSS